MVKTHGVCRARDDLAIANGFTNGHWTADCEHGRIELEVDVAQWTPLVVREYRFGELPPDAAPPGPPGPPPGRCPRKPKPEDPR
jgi:hypothetical protein